jgi:hypothetical protein
MNPAFKNQKLEKNMHVDFLIIKEPNPNADNSKDKNGRASDLIIL